MSNTTSSIPMMKPRAIPHAKYNHFSSMPFMNFMFLPRNAYSHNHFLYNPLHVDATKNGVGRQYKNAPSCNPPFILRVISKPIYPFFFYFFGVFVKLYRSHSTKFVHRFHFLFFIGILNLCIRATCKDILKRFFVSCSHTVQR